MSESGFTGLKDKQDLIREILKIIKSYNPDSDKKEFGGLVYFWI